MHNMYLNIIGNIQCGFKDKEHLEELEKEKGGPDQLSSIEIFDKQKYLQLMGKENLNT